MSLTSQGLCYYGLFRPERASSPRRRSPNTFYSSGSDVRLLERYFTAPYSHATSGMSPLHALKYPNPCSTRAGHMHICASRASTATLLPPTSMYSFIRPYEPSQEPLCSLHHCILLRFKLPSHLLHKWHRRCHASQHVIEESSGAADRPEWPAFDAIRRICQAFSMPSAQH